MNARLRATGLVLLLLPLLAGCYDRMDLEDVTLPLLTGYDLDANGKLIVYAIQPEFSQNENKRSRKITVTADSLRQSREQLDARAAGSVLGRKTLIILIGKKLLQQENWFPLLDVVFRDSKNSLTTRIVAVDGPMPAFVRTEPQDQPLLPLMLRSMIETKSRRSESLKTTLRDFHRQMYEKGQTPAITEAKLETGNEVMLTGTALLNRQGQYVASLTAEETTLLLLLQGSRKTPFSFVLPLEPQADGNPFTADTIGFDAIRVRSKYGTSYREDRFRFKVTIRMDVALTESLFPLSLEGDDARLEQLVSKRLEERFRTLIDKIKALRIDPIGFGIRARAYAYPAYKQTEANWGEAMAAADITVSVKVALKHRGPMK
ncbi:Ger(x)C family spore germination protein [Paenibacillus cymbidii]|uniref:Ger(x)C family spore germination protein n=1 Tax=Paenibacillus cymbidii TaxID=1639034 RepID=UPI0010817A61|nr:Ger(x)C family spore germination protein [Paenibacillus cymbidii]